MSLKLLLGVHNHQPVGNFEHVMEHAYQRAYRPFLDVLSEFPSFKVTYHFTGPLLRFLEARHPDFLEALAHQVKRQQAEIVISGFYEPVLVAIPEADRLGQIRRARRYVKRRLGYEAQGLWLTERVYESEILPALLKSGIRYVVVDDYHFLQTGLTEHQLHGYYLTEHEGKALAIFPISERLRYLIPFRPLEEVMAYLRELHERGARAAVIFDDGEKFGLWPGTYDWVYGREQWLRHFLDRVLQEPWIEPLTYSEFLDEEPPLGRVYLPTGSYFEMGEWALPAPQAKRFADFVHQLKAQGLWDQVRPFVKGGLWRNFLVKYPEVNRMHKKMLLLRRQVERLGRPEKKREAIHEIHQAQCNDAYWHGVFGGVYLPHLRHAVYRHLLRAERALGRRFASLKDHDLDGYQELYLRQQDLVLQISEQGGSLREFSILSLAYNFQNTLTRRYEHYHEGLQVGENRGHGVASIHEISKQISAEAARELRYDWHERVSFLDHFLPADIAWEDLHSMAFQDQGDFVLGRFTLGQHPFRAERTGQVAGQPATVQKFFALHRKGLQVTLRVQASALDWAYVVAHNFILPSALSGEIHAEGVEAVSFATPLDLQGVQRLEFRDATGVWLRLHCPGAHRLVVFPFYTVSQSESGLDLTYQGHALYIFYPLEPGWNRFTQTLEVEKTKGGRFHA